MPRYSSDAKVLNDSDMYQELFDNRGQPKGIVQYKTTIFDRKKFSKDIGTTNHIWSMGDRFYKLSYAYYNRYDYWWVIALFNGKPTEGHMEYGDVLKIPSNPELILRMV